MSADVFGRVGRLLSSAKSDYCVAANAHHNCLSCEIVAYVFVQARVCPERWSSLRYPSVVSLKSCVSLWLAVRDDVRVGSPKRY